MNSQDASNTDKYYTELQSDKIITPSGYEILYSAHINENYLSYLLSIKKLQECDDADAKNTLSTLTSKLNFKLLQDISQKIIDQ